MLNHFYQKNKEKLQKYNGLLMTNPIMERGFILAPIIVASYNTQNSVALGIGFALITFITVMLSSLSRGRFHIRSARSCMRCLHAWFLCRRRC